MKKLTKNSRQLPSLKEEIEPYARASAQVLKKIWDSEDEEKVWSKYY